MADFVLPGSNPALSLLTWRGFESVADDLRGGYGSSG